MDNRASVHNYITNSGTIVVIAVAETTTGEFALAYAYGIYVTNNNTITNSGKIVAIGNTPSESYAIKFTGYGNTLNLKAPSFLGGQLALGTPSGGSAVELNITTGPSHSVLWEFSGDIADGSPTIDGSVRAFWNGTTQQFATIDPTSFAAADDWLADLSGMIMQGLQRRITLKAANRTNPHRSVSAYGGGNGGDPSGDGGGGGGGDSIGEAFTAWVSALGSHSAYDGNEDATLDHDLTQYGFMGGVELEMPGGVNLGLLAGYASGTLEAASQWSDSYDNDAAGFFAGLYGGIDIGQLRLEGTLVGGALDHDSQRIVNNNLMLGGIDDATASYESWWLSPEIGLHADFDMGDGLTITPSLRARYATQQIDAYTETAAAATAAASVEEQQVSTGEIQAELAASRAIEFGTLTGRFGVLGRSAMGDDNVDVTMIGQSASISTENEDRIAGYAGVDLAFDVSDSAVMILSAQALMGDKVTRYQGSASIGVKF